MQNREVKCTVCQSSAEKCSKNAVCCCLEQCIDSRAENGVAVHGKAMHGRCHIFDDRIVGPYIVDIDNFVVALFRQYHTIQTIPVMARVVKKIILQAGKLTKCEQKCKGATDLEFF